MADSKKGVTKTLYKIGRRLEAGWSLEEQGGTHQSHQYEGSWAQRIVTQTQSTERRAGTCSEHRETGWEHPKPSQSTASTVG